MPGKIIGLASRCLAIMFVMSPVLSPRCLSAEVGLFYQADQPQVEFSASEIRAALKARNQTAASGALADLPKGKQEICLAIAGTHDDSQRLAAGLGIREMKPDAPAQSYAVRKRIIGARITYFVLANDSVGAMYGGLDLAEAIRLGNLAEIKDQDHAPFISQRGIKFNVPLDARTPSYSDAGDSAQQNIPEMWSLDFWHDFLDEMARQRFNVISLWNLHPFPSMVKVKEYPDVALADVMRATEKFDTTYALTGHDMVRPSQLAHLETLKKITIEEKIKFWQTVMDYAHDRGIDVYLFTWNVFVWGADGKYGITVDQNNPTTIDYFRKSVAQTLLTYPQLSGIGITAGENMQNRTDEFSKEKWLLKTYGEAILDVKKLQPQRSIRLIHRLNQANVDQVWADWKNFPGQFDFSYKYSIGHMYSSANPPFAKKDLADLPTQLRSWMTVRNDDIYSFRWGDPAYARAYLRGLPGPEILAGFYMGPDGYIWGREFISTEPDSPHQLVIKKQWYSFMLWGRLSFDPALGDELFQKTLETRFPEAAPGKLFAASSAASKIFPQITRFFWGGNDLSWFPEACISHPSHHGFYTVADFIKGSPMPGSEIMSIIQYRDALAQKKPMTGMTPPQVADALREFAAQTLQLLSAMPEKIQNKELRLTIGDLRAMAYLGDYYADKITAAVELATLTSAANAPRQREAAVGHLQAALQDWKQYAQVATTQYRPQLLTRIGYVDLNALTAKVEHDIQIAQEWKPDF